MAEMPTPSDTTTAIVADGQSRLRGATEHDAQQDQRRRAIDERYEREREGAGRLRRLWLSFDRWRDHRRLERERAPDEGLYLALR